MKLDESIEQALRSPEPIPKLRSVVADLFSRGMDKAAVLAMFEDSRQELRQAGREADEDAVMDVMDFLIGWCSPHMKLEPDTAEAQTNGHAAPPDNGQPIQRNTSGHCH